MKSYRELIVWQRAMEIVTEVYSITKSFPKEEVYALTSQIRRCAVSVPSNIAEGYGRQHTLEYIRFLQIARASLYELQTQIEIAVNLNYLTENNIALLLEKCNETERMLNSLINKINNSSK